MSRQSWADRTLALLIRAGVPEGEAQTLVDDSVAEAGDAGVTPDALYGPATAYAAELARAARSADATAAPLAREHGSVVLRLEAVTKRFRRTVVLHGVDLTLRRGEVAAIVGANGSGKSTLLNICAGLDRATSGSVQRTARVGFAPQQGGVSSLLTPEEHFRLFGAAHRMDAARSRTVGTGLAARLGWTIAPGVPAGRLSGGTQQKLNVVLGELARPDLILLDEPYQGFDQSSYIDLWDQIFQWRDAGAGVVVVTHLLRDLDEVDHVIELHTPEES